jgi:hypothetical protein
MNEQDWLQGLQVGDEVAVYGGGMSRGVTIRKVTATSDQYVTVDNTRYRRSNGCQTGSGYMKACIEYPSDEYRARAKKQTLVYRFRNLKPESLTTEQLEQIISIAKQK